MPELYKNEFISLYNKKKENGYRFFDEYSKDIEGVEVSVFIRQKNNENAICNLAMMYRFGEGVEVDYEKSMAQAKNLEHSVLKDMIGD